MGYLILNKQTRDKTTSSSSLIEENVKIGHFGTCM